MNGINHSLPSGTEFKMTGEVCFFPLYAFLVCTGKTLPVVVLFFVKYGISVAFVILEGCMHYRCTQYRLLAAC